MQDGNCEERLTSGKQWPENFRSRNALLARKQAKVRTTKMFADRLEWKRQACGRFSANENGNEWKK